MDLDLDDTLDLHAPGKAGRDDAKAPLVAEGDDAVGTCLYVRQWHLGLVVIVCDKDQGCCILVRAGFAQVDR